MAGDPKINRLKGITSKINLVGNDDQIKTQLSLLLGVAELLDVTGKGLDLNFEKWIEDFENGFKNFAPRLNKTLNLKPWGQVTGERPRVRILTENKAYWVNEGYYLVEFLPNRDVLEESYMLFGTPIQLMQELIRIMNNYLSKDRSDWIGYPIDDYITRTPEHLNSKLFLQLYEQKSPPYRRNQKRVSISVPEVPKEKLDWGTIKNKLGANGYLFGRFITTVIYANGRQTQVYASSKEKSLQLATELSELSSLNIQSIRTSEIYKTGIHDTNAFREYEEKMVYPGTMYVLKIFSTQNGKKRSKKSSPFIPLWSVTKPNNFNDLIKDVWVAPLPTAN
jgi:hypothetical protein